MNTSAADLNDVAKAPFGPLATPTKGLSKTSAIAPASTPVKTLIQHNRVDLFSKANAVLLCALAGGSLSLTGCMIGGTGDVRVHNRELRQERAELVEEVAALEMRVEGLMTQLEAAERGDNRDALLTAQRLVLTEIRIGRYSTPLDTNKDGVDDTLKVYLTTHDQAGRGFAAHGSVKVQLVKLDEQGEASLLAEGVFDEKAVADSYRLSFIDAHYSLVVPLPDLRELVVDAAGIEIRVAFTDGVTGAVLTGASPVSLK